MWFSKTIWLEVNCVIALVFLFLKAFPATVICCSPSRCPRTVVLVWKTVEVRRCHRRSRPRLLVEMCTVSVPVLVSQSITSAKNSHLVHAYFQRRSTGVGSSGLSVPFITWENCTTEVGGEAGVAEVALSADIFDSSTRLAAILLLSCSHTFG